MGFSLIAFNSAELRCACFREAKTHWSVYLDLERLCSFCTCRGPKTIAPHRIRGPMHCSNGNMPRAPPLGSLVNTSRVSLSSRFQSNLIEDQITITLTTRANGIASADCSAISESPRQAARRRHRFGLFDVMQAFSDCCAITCRRTASSNGQCRPFFAKQKMVEDSGIEPLTYWLQTSRSPS